MTTQPIYEGKAKRLYATENPNILRMEYKDTATAGNGAKKEEFENKGRLNKAITLATYKMLHRHSIPTHLIEDIDETNLKVAKVNIIPLEVIVRNIAAGSFSRRMGVTEGTKFKQPIVEFSYKDDSLGDPFINDDYAREMGAATSAECQILRTYALRVNKCLQEFFDEAGMTLVDFKLEFGKPTNPDVLPNWDGVGIILADEITPDTCRLWDKATGKKMDKDLFRQNIGGLIEAYAEVLNRIEK